VAFVVIAIVVGRTCLSQKLAKGKASNSSKGINVRLSVAGGYWWVFFYAFCSRLYFWRIFANPGTRDWMTPCAAVFIFSIVDFCSNFLLENKLFHVQAIFRKAVVIQIILKSELRSASNRSFGRIYWVWNGFSAWFAKGKALGICNFVWVRSRSYYGCPSALGSILSWKEFKSAPKETTRWFFLMFISFYSLFSGLLFQDCYKKSLHHLSWRLAKSIFVNNQ